MSTIPPADSTRSPGALSAHDNDSHVLAELLDDVFTRGYTGSNGTLKDMLVRTSDCVYDHYQKVLQGQEVDPVAHYRQHPATAFSKNGSPYEIMVIPMAKYDSPSSTEGGLIIYIQKRNKVPFSPRERQILENYPMKFILKDSKGLEVARTEAATPINARDGGGSAVKLEFLFDIQNGTASIKSGAETFEEHTRIIDLPIRSPLI